MRRGPRRGSLRRSQGVVSGIEIAAQVFREVDKGLGIWTEKADGEAFEPGDVLLKRRRSSAQHPQRGAHRR